MPLPTGPDAPAGAAHDAATEAAPRAGRERRQHHHLRDLIDEMKATIRATVSRELWTAEEREAADADLARIMARVKAESLAVAQRDRELAEAPAPPRAG